MLVACVAACPIKDAAEKQAAEHQEGDLAQISVKVVTSKDEQHLTLEIGEPVVDSPPVDESN